MQGRRVFGAILLVLVAAVAAPGAQALLPNQSRIYVSIMDGKVAATAPRDAEAFHVWESGVSRPVVSASPAAEAPSIVVIIHGFERGETADARKALTAFVDAIRAGSPNARIALIGDVKTPQLTNITTDAAKLDEFARRFAVSGTNMVFFETIVDAAKALGKEASDRRIIVTLTKSTKYDSDTAATQRTVDILKKSHASVWSIDVTPENAGSISNMHATTEMEGFVGHAFEYSGGAGDRIFGTTSLPAAMTRFAGLILAQYQVTFERPDRPGETELRVGVSGVATEKVIGPGWFVR